MKFFQKVYLCGITSSEYQNIFELIEPIYEYFDGLVWAVHDNPVDGTLEYLESRKKEGEIIRLSWQRNHGTSYQTVLNSRKILPRDQVLVCDSLERWNPDFCRKIRDFIYKLDQNNINTVYNYGKILMFKYFPEITFTPNSPHCVPQNLRPNAIDMANIPELADETKHRYNVRPLKRAKDEWIGHFFRYVLSYKISNQMFCGNEGNIEEYRRQEQARQDYLVYCYRILNFDDITEETMTKYLKEKSLDEVSKDFFNYNKYINDWYCYNFLGHSLEDIIKRHKKKELFNII